MINLLDDIQENNTISAPKFTLRHPVEESLLDKAERVLKALCEYVLGLVFSKIPNTFINDAVFLNSDKMQLDGVYFKHVYTEDTKFTHSKASIDIKRGGVVFVETATACVKTKEADHPNGRTHYVSFSDVTIPDKYNICIFNDRLMATCAAGNPVLVESAGLKSNQNVPMEIKRVINDFENFCVSKPKDAMLTYLYYILIEPIINIVAMNNVNVPRFGLERTIKTIDFIYQNEADFENLGLKIDHYFLDTFAQIRQWFADYSLNR